MMKKSQTKMRKTGILTYVIIPYNQFIVYRFTKHLE